MEQTIEHQNLAEPNHQAPRSNFNLPVSFKINSSVAANYNKSLLAKTSGERNPIW